MIVKIENVENDPELMLVMVPYLGDKMKVVRRGEKCNLVLAREDFVFALFATVLFWPACVSPKGYKRIADLMDRVRLDRETDPSHISAEPQVHIHFEIKKRSDLITSPDFIAITFKCSDFFLGALQELQRNPVVELSILPEELRSGFIKRWIDVSDILTANAEK